MHTVADKVVRWYRRQGEGAGISSMFLDEEKGVEELKEQDGWSVTD